VNNHNTRATFPQTIYAVAFTVRKTVDGPIVPAIETFDVSGENPLTAREATDRAAAMLPKEWHWLEASVGIVVQKTNN